MPPDDQSRRKTFGEILTLWVGVIGSVVTIVLTMWNASTKRAIDQREQNLKDLEVQLKARSTGVEESKERVERYKWVFSLFPDLKSSDGEKRAFTVNMIRLALNDEEQKRLFAGLQASTDKQLQSLGQTGIASIQNEPAALLVAEMNASTAEARKGAVALLERDYKDSSQAIALTLRAYDKDHIDTLSPSGIINGLYFLSATEPSAWDAEHAAMGRDVLSRVEKKQSGPQTQEALNKFRALLAKLPP